MGIDNFIELALRGVLNNPILGVLREINISKILIQSASLPLIRTA